VVAGELRLAQGAAEEAGLDRGAEVLDRAGGCGDRDAVAVGDLGRGQGAGAVKLETGTRRPTNSGGDGEADRTLKWAQEFPQRRGTRVAQDSAVPRREHRRQPSSPPTEAAMPDRVYAAVQAM
jgi:hypothetical protein